MSGQNTRQFLADTLQELAAAQIDTWIFGGWAEELHGIRPPGPHGDIDLLYPAENFYLLDQMLSAHSNMEEIQGKRFVHKRAFVWRGVLIEIFLLRSAATGFVTDFFGLHQFHWPKDAVSQTLLLGVPAPSASPVALRFYREQHTAVEQAYQQHLAPKDEVSQRQGRRGRQKELRGNPEISHWQRLCDPNG